MEEKKLAHKIYRFRFTHTVSGIRFHIKYKFCHILHVPANVLRSPDPHLHKISTEKILMILCLCDYILYAHPINSCPGLPVLLG